MNSPRRPDFWLTAWLAALAVTVVAVGLHVYFLLHVGGLWRDEVHLVNLAGLGSLGAMSHDSFPVLMPLLIRGWEIIGPGKTDFGLRLLGLLIGLGLPAALWLMAWKFHRTPPLPGLALLALNGTVIVFGDSLRAHGLGSLLILLTVAAASWFLAKPSWRRAAGWAVLAVLSVQTLFQNAIFIAAICAGAWTVCARQKAGRTALKVFLVGLTAAVSLLPYLPNFVSLNAGAGSLRTGIEPGRLQATFATAFGYPLDQCRWLWPVFLLTMLAVGLAAIFPRRKTAGEIPLPKCFPPARWTLLLAALVAATGFLWFAAAPANHWWIFPALALAVVWLDEKYFSAEKTPADSPGGDGGNLALFGGVTLLVAAIGFAAFLWYAALPTEQWYFIPLLALAAGCFEIGLPVRGHARAAVLGFSIVVMAVAGVVVFADQKAVNWRLTNIDLLCQRLATEAAPEDLVVVSPWYCGITFERYFKGPAHWETAPPLSDHSLARYDLVHAQMQKPRVMQPLIEQAEAVLRAGHRVWLVGMMAIPEPGAPLPADLPPPPLPHSGWSDRPYTETWVLQANQFLSNHSREFKMVYETPLGNLNFMENVQLYRVEGWHD
jgi:hypothetical protein